METKVDFFFFFFGGELHVIKDLLAINFSIDKDPVVLVATQIRQRFIH